MDQVPRTVIVLTSRRHPGQALLYFLSVVQGLTFVTHLSVGPPQSLQAILPPWLLAVWSWSLLVSGGVGLTGEFWPWHILTSLRMRLAGALMAAAPASAFCLAAFAYAGVTAAYAAGVLGVWAAACLWRAAQLSVDIGRLTGGSVIV